MDSLYEKKISIIVPVYNIQEYVPKCIESLCSQTYKNIEIILVDDGSTDHSGAICDQYAQKDARIKVVHKENGGQTSARLAGAEIASGDYVLSVDGDDWVDITRVEQLVNNGIQSDADMIYMNGLYRVYGDNVIVDKYRTLPGLYSADEIFDKLIDIRYCFKREMIASACYWAVKRELYKKAHLMVDQSVTVGEDILFTWLCVLNASSVYIIDNCTYYYFQRPSSVSHTAGDAQAASVAALYKQIKSEVDKKQCEPIMYRRLALAVMRSIVAVDCSKILGQSDTYLYPYSSIHKGSKVVVYGAGDVGTRIVRFLSDNKDYSLCAWIDKYERKKVECGWQASAIESVYDLEYDYIAIAIADYDFVAQVKEELMERGIPEEKIAIMEPNVIDIESVERSIGLS